MPYAIDLFCGAGGFSEGILQSGFEIVFSSDVSPMVMETYTNRHRQLGIIEGRDTHFELADIKELTAEKIFTAINSLKYGNVFNKGDVDVIFGGPPCQGFSRLGKRDASDPRNMLFHEYLRIIRDLRPKYVVMENVTGILDMQMLDFPSVLDKESKYEGQNLVINILEEEFSRLDYTLLDVQVLNAADYGVPQQRNRVVFLAYRNDMPVIEYPKPHDKKISVYDAFGDLYHTTSFDYSTSYSIESKEGRTKNINTNKPIAQLKITNMEKSIHDESVVQRFSLYEEGENQKKTALRLSLTGINLKEEAPALYYESLFQLNSIQNKIELEFALKQMGLSDQVKMANSWMTHTNKQLSKLFFYEKAQSINEFNRVIESLSRRLNSTLIETYTFWDNIKSKLNQDIAEERFDEALANGNLTDSIKEAIFTRKGVRSRLDSKKVSPTMVTLPDDFIHPYFNRILTVREMARLQSFDDSFEFLGKRTTGGLKRAQEVPQFTQVGNAVPPLLAKAIADKVKEALEVPLQV